MTTLEELDRAWRKANRLFEENDRRGPAAGPAWEVKVGRSSTPAILALHAVKHNRPAIGPKANDANTGGLVLALSAVSGASCAVLRRSDWPGGDPNWALDHPIRAALVEAGLVYPGSTVLDIHGMSNAHQFDVAIGLGSATPGTVHLGELIAAAFDRVGFSVDLGGVKSGHSAASERTITRWAQSGGASAVQVEIALRRRSFIVPSVDRQPLLVGFLDALSKLSPHS